MAYWWWNSGREVDELRHSVNAVRWHGRHNPGSQPEDFFRWADDMDRLLQAIDARRRYHHARRVARGAGA